MFRHKLEKLLSCYYNKYTVIEDMKNNYGNITIYLPKENIFFKTALEIIRPKSIKYTIYKLKWYKNIFVRTKWILLS